MWREVHSESTLLCSCRVQGKELIWNEFGVGGGISQVHLQSPVAS